MGICQSKDNTSSTARAPAQATASSPERKKNSDGITTKERFKNIAMAPIKLDENFVFPQFPKTTDEREVLAKAVTGNFIFSEIAPFQREQLLDAFEKFAVSNGFKIITEGETGDYFYIVQTGGVQFTKKGVEVGKAGPGMSFGDLALLYDSPRAATCIAMEDCTLWRVDQTTFRQILANSSVTGDRSTMEILRKVEFLRDLSDEYIAKIASAVEQESFKKGDVIIRKGDMGTLFYILKTGSVQVKDIESGLSSATADKSYDDIVLKAGDFFGERAILKEEPRNATIVALEDCTVLTLSHTNFLDMIGPMASLIKITQDTRQLKVIPTFARSDLMDSEYNELASRILDISLSKNTVLLKEGATVEVNGDSEPALYLVRSGEVKVTSKADSTLDSICGPGSYFGHNYLLSPDNVVTAQTTSDAVLGRLKMSEIQNVVRYMLRLDPAKWASEASSRQIGLKDLTKRRVLGQGAFGVVWLVSTTKSNKTQTYALKIQMKKQLIASDQVEGTIREIQIMSNFDHPFVLPLLNLYQDEFSIMMLLPLIQGGELLELITKSKDSHLSEKAAKFYAAGILEGLHYMHIRSIAHRDMKPENVLISQDGFPILVDFGFAKEIKDKSFTLCGSPLYIAPENILGKGHDLSCDYWSWACMVMEMLTGATPFENAATSQNTLFKAIVQLDHEIYGPKVAVDLVKRVLVRSKQRLGNLAGGTRDLKEHAWFKDDVDFVKLANMDSDVPYKPDAKDPLDAAEIKYQHQETRGPKEPLTQKEQAKFEKLDDMYVDIKGGDKRVRFQHWVSQRSSL